LIDDEIEECKSSGSCKSFPGDNQFDAGTYFSDSGVSLDSSTFDTSSGNIDVVVNGSLDFNSDTYEITGDGNVTLYVKGDVEMSGNARINSNGDSSDLLMYVHSDAGSVTAAKGTPQYKGLIYAPNTDLNIKGGGKCKNAKNDCNGNIVGGIVVRNAEGNGKIRGDDDIDITLEFADSAAITYLHISENRVEIKDS
jgi:hypothetical protein